VADLRERLQSGLVDRYQLERELGRGGRAAAHQRPAPTRGLLARTSASRQPQARWGRHFPHARILFLERGTPPAFSSSTSSRPRHQAYSRTPGQTIPGRVWGRRWGDSHPALIYQRRAEAGTAGGAFDGLFWGSAVPELYLTADQTGQQQPTRFGAKSLVRQPVAPPRSLLSPHCNDLKIRVSGVQFPLWPLSRATLSVCGNELAIFCSLPLLCAGCLFLGVFGSVGITGG
jgi:hypothetical protein